MGSRPSQSRAAAWRGQRNSSAEHFCYDEDDEGPEKASSAEEIYQGVTGGGKHGYYYQCGHLSLNR